MLLLPPRLRLPRRLPPSPAAARVAPRRAMHLVPKLEHEAQYAATGVPDLLTPQGFAFAWTDQMALITEKLNALTAGTELEARDAKTILLQTAREPTQAPIFNYASMAHNTHFFFRGIAPQGTPMPADLRRELEASFSVETLRREFVLTAHAMFGPGFVWLVKAGPADYRLLPTYLAGSPYPGAHWRRQRTDMNTVGDDGSARPFFQYQHHAAAAAAAARRRLELPPGGIELEPLLCLSTWEHAWLPDWGVGAGGQGGKLAFAESWWDHIDWVQVAVRSGVQRAAFKSANAAEAA